MLAFWAGRCGEICCLAKAELFRPQWSGDILEETQKLISRITNGDTDGVKERKESEDVFPYALVSGYEFFMNGLALPDSKDNHVLAATISISAPVIVTENLRHFPDAILSHHNIKAISSDSFIADIIDLYPSESITELKRMRQRFKKPAMDVSTLIRVVEEQGLLEIAKLLDQHRALL